MTSPRRACLLLLGSALLLSCSRSRPPIRNVLLISIDTLRADRVSAYGFPRPTTPNIDAVAGEGVLFKNVHTPVPMTLPAHVSMLTGTLPPTHGLRDNLLNRLPEGSLTLAHWMSITQTLHKNDVPLRQFILALHQAHYEGRPPPSVFSN